MINKEEIGLYFREIDEALARQGLTGEIVICGGAVMAYVYDARPSTKDVDALFEPAAVLRGIASEIAEKHGLEEDWLNDAAKGFIDTSKMRFESVETLKALKITRPDDEGMLAMKLASAREDSHDAEDALFLIRRLGIQSEDEILDLLERNIPSPRLTPKVGFFAKEMLLQAFGSDLFQSARQSSQALGQESALEPNRNRAR